MPLRTSDILPCQTFFARGRSGAGVVALLMQVSVFFWPLAASWARKYSAPGGRAKVNMDKVLDELVRANRPPEDPFARPLKTFKPAPAPATVGARGQRRM